MELDFNFTSFIIILTPVILLLWAVKKKKVILQTFILFVVHLAWLIFWYFELTCNSESCLEWETNSSGSVLILFSMFPFFISIISIPWYFSLFKKIKKSNKPFKTRTCEKQGFF